MDLRLLYDGDHHHYVLITDLVKVVCYVRRIDFRYCYQICWKCRIFGYVETDSKVTMCT